MDGGRVGALAEGGSETRNAIHSSARTRSEQPASQPGSREKVSEFPPSILHHLCFLKGSLAQQMHQRASLSPSLPSFTLVCMPLAARLCLIDCHRLKPLRSLIQRTMDLFFFVRFLLNGDHRLSESGVF